jgi:hypothetical protein
VVAFDEDAVAGPERDVELGVLVEILKPDTALLVAAGHHDLRDLGLDRDAARAGEHRGQRPGRPVDRIDALRAHAADQRHGRPVARDAADEHLRIGRLLGKPFGDQAAHGLGGVARSAEAARDRARR